MKSIVKLFYVVLLPIVVITTALCYLFTDIHMSGLANVICVLSIITVISNSFFWMVHWDNTSMVPIINFEFQPVFGLAIGVDNGYKKDVALMIVLPFMTLEIKRRKK